jgi:large subunit ribosomal protein L32e
MKDIKRLLEIRNKLKARKPKFAQQDTHKKVKLKEKWRKPRGIDSKLRLNLSGKRKKPSKGFRSPEETRGLSKSGLRQIIVHNAEQLNNIDKSKEGILIASAVGTKNKIMITKKAIELNLTILNLKNPQEYISGVESKIQEKKTKKQEKEKQKETKKKEKEKKAAEKDKKKEDKKEDELTKKLEDEEKKKEEKKETERTLIHTS